jgi:hypothetical protein
VYDAANNDARVTTADSPTYLQAWPLPPMLMAGDDTHLLQQLAQCFDHFGWYPFVEMLC